MMAESDNTAEATRRLNVKKQTLDDAYAIPANFLEIDVVNPLTTLTAAKKRYTDYEVRMRVSCASAVSFGGEGRGINQPGDYCTRAGRNVLVFRTGDKRGDVKSELLLSFVSHDDCVFAVVVGVIII